MAQYASYLKTLICQSLSLLLFDVDLKIFVTFWLEPNILNKMRLFQAWKKTKQKCLEMGLIILDPVWKY